MRALGILLCILACGVSVAAPQTQKASLTGFVTDSEGAVIKGAEVLVHWDPSGSTVGLTTNVGIKEDLHLKTNDEGRFWTEIPPGFYDIFVTWSAFTPECRKIRLKAGDSGRVSFALKPNALVTAEIGHKLISDPK